MWHVVKAGESTASLAFEHGHFWKTVWNAPENEPLRRQRPCHNILFAGDRVFLPEIRPGEKPAATEAVHRFRLKGVPEWLKVQCLDEDGEPYGGEPFEVDVDGAVTRGKLDGQGWLRVPIVPNARKAHLRVGKDGEHVDSDLQVGHLDPVSEVSGVQGRLQNLGFYRGPLDGQQSRDLRSAVRAFRRHSGLPEGVEIDADLRSKLEAMHGS